MHPTAPSRALLILVAGLIPNAAIPAQGWLVPRPCITEVWTERPPIDRPAPPVRDCRQRIVRTRSDVRVELVDRVLRYETHVRRALQQTVQELEVRQAHREGKSTPLARVAFSSGPVLRVPGARGTARFTAMKQLNEDLREINSAIGERHTARLKIAEDVRREAREALEPEP